ncbi:MAG: hypothetical protein ABFD89_00830 [Bryobacteraceae bacterium]
MIDPSELVDNLVTKLRLITSLVADVGGVATNIYAYHDSHPTKSSLMAAILQMQHPSVMAVWQGTAPGSIQNMTIWKHQVTLYLRAKEESAAGTAYCDLFRHIVEGVPTDETLAMLYVEVHASCLPMDIPSISRQTDVEGQDYFEIPLSFTER